MDDAPKPKTVLERLQPWQPSIAAMLGFSGVILAMLYIGHKDRAIKAEEEFRTARATAYGIYLDMERIEETLRRSEFGAYYAQKQMLESKSNRVEYCMRNFEIAREKKIEPIGVFEAVRSNLGRLPPQIMNHYLTALSRLDDVKEVISTSAADLKLRCERTPIAQVGSARYAFSFAVHAIGQLGHALVQQYPDLAPISRKLTDRPEYIQFDEKRETDRKLQIESQEEFKAAISTAEAEEAAEVEKLKKK